MQRWIKKARLNHARLLAVFFIYLLHVQKSAKPGKRIFDGRGNEADYRAVRGRPGAVVAASVRGVLHIRLQFAVHPGPRGRWNGEPSRVHVAPGLRPAWLWRQGRFVGVLVARARGPRGVPGYIVQKKQAIAPRFGRYPRHAAWCNIQKPPKIYRKIRLLAQSHKRGVALWMVLMYFNDVKIRNK